MRIYLKREDLNHTGAHKINNCVGQALLARRMGKKRLIAETGAGQHGVATATVAAKFGLPCEVFMGAEDVERQKLNVFRMRLLGAKVHAVESGTRTLKDAMNEALRDWVTNVRDTHYIIGSVAGPHPYPTMVRDLQAVIGREARAQVLERDGRLPDAGGGLRRRRLERDGPVPRLRRRRRRAAARRRSGGGGHRHRTTRGDAVRGARRRPARLEVVRAHRRRRPDPAGALDLRRARLSRASAPSTRGSSSRARATYASVTDAEALAALQLLARTEGILCALETAHAIAYLPRLCADACATTPIVVVALSGRGDKDMPTVAKALGVES